MAVIAPTKSFKQNSTKTVKFTVKMMRRAVLQILIRFEYRQWQSKLQGSNGIRTHGLRGSAAVLHQPSHENPCIESRPIC